MGAMLRAPSRPPELGTRVGVRRSATHSPWREPVRIAWIAVGGTLAVLVIFVLSLGPLVRARVKAEAERRKLDVVVGSVRPGLFAVSLHDVRIRPRTLDGISAQIDEVRVVFGGWLSVQEVRGRGGFVFVEGDVDDVVRRVRDFRGSLAPRAAMGGAEASSRPVSFENVTLSWKMPSGEELRGQGMSISRDSRGIALVCAKCTATYRRTTVEVAGGIIELFPDGAPNRVVAHELSIVREPLVVTRGSPVATAVSTDPPPAPVPPPLPLARKPPSKGVKTGTPPALPTVTEPVLPLPDLHELRTRIATVVASLASRMPDGGSVEVGGLSAKFEVGLEPLTLGPGAFSLTRSGERVHLKFTSTRASEAETGEGTPLSIDAELPIGPGEVAARLAGGPVSLALLGVKEGTKGLADVAHGTLSGKGQVTLSAEADALTFDGDVTLRSIAMTQPKLAPEPLRGIDLSISAHGVLDDVGHLRVDDAELAMGALRMRTHGTVDQTPEYLGASLTVDVATTACQSLLESAPQELLPTVRPARMTGTFGASGHLSFDTRSVEKLALDYRIDDLCTMVEVPQELARDRFTSAFTYRTYKPDGTMEETTTGPGTPSWTGIDDISPFMIAAVLTTEDGAFYKHKGFNHAAIRSSVQANLKAGKFVRGASTITMQLAKNLFLSRDKALSRKLEEVILTDYLEQIFPKDDMMELYLNIVEFGPDVYGVTRAAEYYFGRKPEELNLAEAFFLATLLPSPLRYGKLRDKGEVPEMWMRHLKALMEIAAKNGKITHEELEVGLTESVVFVKPGQPLPEPRKPVTSTRRYPGDNDDPWRPLD